MKSLAKIWAIARKDLSVELRGREAFAAMFVFAVLVLLVFNFALPEQLTRAAAPGVLWVAILFAGMLGLTRSFVLEQQDGGLHGLRLAPMDPGIIYAGKTLANFLMLVALEILLVPICVVLFDLPVGVGLARTAPVFLLATLGFVGVGTLFAAMAVNTRIREVMMPLLLLPVLTPVLLAAVRSTGALLSGDPWTEAAPWLKLLVAFDVLYLGISVIVFDYVVEE